MGRHPSPLGLTFLRLSTTTPVTVAEAQHGSNLNVDELLKLCVNYHHARAIYPVQA